MIFAASTIAFDLFSEPFGFVTADQTALEAGQPTGGVEVERREKRKMEGNGEKRRLDRKRGSR